MSFQLIALLALSTTSPLASTLPWNQDTRSTDNVSATEIQRIVKRSPLLALKIPGVKLVPVPNLKKLPLKKLPFKKLPFKKLPKKKLLLKKIFLKMLPFKKLKKLKKKLKIVWNAKKLKVIKAIASPRKVPKPGGVKIKKPVKLPKPVGIGFFGTVQGVPGTISTSDVVSIDAPTPPYYG